MHIYKVPRLDNNFTALTLNLYSYLTDLMEKRYAQVLLVMIMDQMMTGAFLEVMKLEVLMMIVFRMLLLKSKYVFVTY